jgi:hypothetical protein
MTIPVAEWSRRPGHTDADLVAPAVAVIEQPVELVDAIALRLRAGEPLRQA